MRYRFEYLIFVFVKFVIWLLPRRFVLAVGTALGWAVYVLHRPRRQLALDNLMAAFPHRLPAEHRTIARASFAHFGRIVLDLIKLNSWTSSRLMSQVEFENADTVVNAYAQGRGVIFYSGHFGFWELQLIAHAFQFEPMAVVSRILDNPWLEAAMVRVRSRGGTRVIHRRGAIRRLRRELANRRGIAMMIDQHIHDSSAIDVDFFNHPAATTSAIALLALRTGAPVVPLFSVPVSGGRYRLICEPPVKAPSTDDPEAVREFTQRCTDVLEMYVRRYPHLWLWMHRRWREAKLRTERVDTALNADNADKGTRHLSETKLGD